MQIAPQPAGCSCGCHDGFQRPCTLEGGCGRFHPTSPNTRPDWACVTCRPPIDGRVWRQASPGYATCEGCLERLDALLQEISDRYGELSPAPGSGAGDGTRGSPGFGSRSPASDHIITMMDPRSATGDNARTWRGSDGRLYRESERPPLSIFSVLDCVAWDVAEARDYEGGHKQLSVQGLCTWLRGQLDWLTRRADVSALHDTLRSLVNQLRPVTGDPRKRIGRCPNTIDDGEHSRECAAPLYAPTHGSHSIATNTIRCGACGREWSRSEWLRLADLLDAS